MFFPKSSFLLYPKIGHVLVDKSIIFAKSFLLADNKKYLNISLSFKEFISKFEYCIS